MELYKLTVTIWNETPEAVFDFAYLPENFKGVQISQKFNFQNPIGYTPKFSIDTMKIIKSDKVAIDAVFNEFGLQSNVQIDIYELKSNGYEYELNSSFSIDFESYEKFDVYSEFALKAISTIDFYNSIKNTERQIELTDDAYIPITQFYINYVSLKSPVTYPLQFIDSRYLQYWENGNESKIYNTDEALVDYSTTEKTVIYRFKTITTTSKLKISSTGNFTFYNPDSLTVGVIVSLCKVSSAGVYTTLKNYFSGIFSDNMVLDLNIDDYDLPSLTLNVDDSIVLTTQYTTDNHAFGYPTISIDLKLQTQIAPLSGVVPFKYIPNSDVLSSIFNNQITLSADNIFDYGFTSGNQLAKNSNYANFKPKDFLYDLCLMGGFICNFKIDGTVKIEKQSDYFNNLFDTANAIEITNFKNLSFNYANDLNFASVSVGMEKQEYDVYTYFQDWNKILTFAQSGRNASENLELTLSKLRVDFSGMLDLYLKRSVQTDKIYKDNFVFDPSFGGRFPYDGISYYDFFMPRDIALNWSKFMSFVFQNFGLDTLVISSNGGSTDDLQIGTVRQMDDIVLNETPRLLPIEIKFDCTIEGIDFSEKIVKIDNEGEIIYIFVVEATTQDELSEQNIRGLKIIPNNDLLYDSLGLLLTDSNGEILTSNV